MSDQPVILKSSAITPEQWRTLSSKKIYFGHQSVGFNIMDGIKEIMKKNPAIRLNLRETKDPGEFKTGIFAHSPNGENLHPKTKVDAFVKTMTSGLGRSVDIAFFKLCFVDINPDTDVKELFKYYKTALTSLKAKYPKVIFIHATVPLTTEDEQLSAADRIKDLVKKVLGRRTRAQTAVLSNINKNEYNRLLRDEFRSDYIIDVEQYESTRPDGTRLISTKEGKKHFSLVPAYSSDGGHLTGIGKIAVADSVLALLAGIR